MIKKAPLLLFFLFWLGVGCDLANSADQPTNGEPGGEIVPGETAVSANTPPPESTPDIAIPATPVTDTQSSLRVWIPPEIALSSDEGAAVLNAQLAAFRTNHPDVIITVEQKSASGQSGILNYIRTGRTIAPNVMPDLIAIPTEQLGPALSEELIYPLDGLIEVDLLEDLFPAALELALQDNQVIGYPFALTRLPQLVYNQELVTRTIPSTWSSFIELPNSFVFPANGEAGGTLGLQLYLAAGGTLINEVGQVTLEAAPLASALQPLASAKTSGLILEQSSNFSSLQESWQLFQSGTAAIALTSSEQYLRERGTNESLPFTAVPGLDRPLTPVVTGWAWALSTADPEKQAVAADLLDVLISSNQLGEWSFASNLLPARRAALAFWPQEDAYVDFAQEQLNRAIALPIRPNSTIMTALNNAVFDVVSLAKTPQAAAEEAVASLQP